MTLAVKDGAGLPVSLVSRTVSSEEVPAHDSIPLATPDLTWIVDADMSADTDYDSVDCQRFGTIWMEFIMAATAEGDLYIEWSMDDVTFYPFVIDTGKFSLIDPGTDITPDEALGKFTVAALGAEARIGLGIERPPPFMRARWDFTAGSATGMDAKSFGRG